MNKAIEIIHNLIYEHETQNNCIDYDKAIKEFEQNAVIGFDKAYDVGRYEALKEALRLLQKEI